MELETASSISIGPGIRRVGWGACPDDVGALILEEVEKDFLRERKGDGV
jgi:hypothetical protein